MDNCENICGICGDYINNNENNLDLTCTKLKCGHKFHYICISYSYKFSKSSRCPYCRQEGGKIIKPLQTCLGIIKTGKNKGNRCKCKVLNDEMYCGRHIKQNINI